MKKSYVTIAFIFGLFTFCFAQTDIPNVANNGPMGQGSWIRFTSGGGNSTSIQEYYGLNLLGTSGQPVKIANTSFLVGYPSSGANFGSGNAYISGNVGIGTSAATSKLDIVGAGGGNIDLRVNGRIWAGAGDGANQAGVWIGTTGMLVGQSSGTSMGFWNGNAWRLTVDNTGKVAIGTTDVPGDHLLYVNGSVLATDVSVKPKTAWPDYVFADNYKLPSLSELELFIKANRHLPEVPAAEEVKEDGVRLGELNAVLLKKIEEMTLYLIELKQEMIELKHENETQNKEITELKKQVSKE
jgi:hypothetical protein